MMLSPYLRRGYRAIGFSAALVIAASWQLAVAQEAPKNFVMHAAPKPLMVLSFEDSQGQKRSLADFNGKVAVVNIWATWCAPCREEMPALDRLQAATGGADFTVVPVSIDRGGIGVVGKFYEEIGIRHLPKYIDTSGQILRTVAAVGLPTTLIVDRAGAEVGRVVGPVEWDAPEISTVLKAVIARTPDQIDHANRAQREQTSQERPSMVARGIQWLKELFVR